MPLVKKGWMGRDIYDNPWAPGATEEVLMLPHLLLSPRSNWHQLLCRPPSVMRDIPPADVCLEDLLSHSSEDDMRVTWIGHATVLVQMNGLTILTDPMFSERASYLQSVGPKRYTPPAIALEDLPKVDLVLLSHNHFDHLDTASADAIGNSALWLVPLGLKRWFSRRGIVNCVEMNWWDETELPIGRTKVACLPAQHWSARNGFDRNQSLWSSWAVISGSESFFFGGDTAYCPVFPSIADCYGPFDISALPIGAYEPSWFMKSKHCSPDEAVKIHSEIKSRRSIGIHWGTFDLANDSYLQPPRDLKDACEKAGLPGEEFKVIQHGESVRKI
ncbi:unnamed protein product [Chrysoparadoxa australica]